ncbi:MAG: membrane protein insertase YidC [Cyanobacteriota bacterium]|nr:membrane protein insertase YidC [Cyanobacteriota bacterium]
MDFGVGFLSNNVMLPILDFFYGIVPSYGLAIIFLTLVIRFALYPLNVGSIRSMRKMKVVQPLMQKRTKEVQERYKDDPQKLREAQSQMYSEFGVNPLGGCLPLFVQMPVLFALFATLRGSPFAAVTFDINLQILPSEVMADVVPAPFTTPAKNIFLTETLHKPVVLTDPRGQKIGVGEQVPLLLQGAEGKNFAELLAEAEADASKLTPTWTITKGGDRAQIQADGTLVALEPGDVTVQASIPGLAADTGFLFIDKLGRVGAFDEDGTIHWDIIAMILVFGVSIYVNQSLTGQSSPSNNADEASAAQNSANKITPILFSGMFLFFPLPAGVLLYILISNIFQTVQTYLLSLEPLDESLQSLIEAERQTATQEVKAEKSKRKEAGERESLPFEP